ncbi:hypothetical protein Clacol_007972 [Clathrus columnatus]|uniref:AB hydrolase-1 domain-containing protein n=1 Tax=Clathrus columnatus TaxID=1419009 RepID=A0AAV5AMR4_9AGAM|nr:hypothetical protein Clacol_007972 [Clathrus columnatus]
MKITYQAIPGFFADPLDNDDPNIQQVQPRFGLIDESFTRWEDLKSRISVLNREAPVGTSYKVVFIGRHGEGYHNLAEVRYGSPEWNRHWAKLNGDGKIVWGPDPVLTELGIQQAYNVNEVWKEEQEFGIPLPESLYSSPLTRAVNTAVITFENILFSPTGPPKLKTNYKRLIKEVKLREVNGVHTCDMRRSRSYLLEKYPHFDIESGFTEEDELWQPDHRETEEELKARLRQALDEIFANESSTYISITAHGGAIRAIRRVLNVPPRKIPTGVGRNKTGDLYQKHLLLALVVQFMLSSVDLRNHGTSPHTTPMTYSAMADDVVHFCQTHSLSKVSLLGHSIIISSLGISSRGGKVVMSAALSPTLPKDLLTNLIIADIAPARGPLSSDFKEYTYAMSRIEHSRIKSRKEANDILLQTEPDPSIRAFLLTNLTLDKDAGYVKFRIPIDLIKDALDELGDFPYDPEKDHRWDGRTLVIKGEKSRYLNKNNIPLVHHFFPNARLESLDAGHWVHAEKPHEFVDLVTDFIKN